MARAFKPKAGHVWSARFIGSEESLRAIARLRNIFYRLFYCRDFGGLRLAGGGRPWPDKTRHQPESTSRLRTSPGSQSTTTSKGRQQISQSVVKRWLGWPVSIVKSNDCPQNGHWMDSVTSMRSHSTRGHGAFQLKEHLLFTLGPSTLGDDF